VGVASARDRTPVLARERGTPRQRHGAALLRLERGLLVPVGAAFVERFSVGLIVVSFALLAHRAHGLSDSMIGYLFAMLTLPFALLMYPVGRLSERVPRAALMSGGAAVYAVALFSLGHAPAAGLPWLMITAGVASALLFSPTLAYAAALAPATERGRAMAVVNASGCLGMLLGPAVGGIVCALLSAPGHSLRGHRAVFALAALCVLAWLAMSLPWLVRQYRRERVVTDAGDGNLARSVLSLPGSVH
jgi:MFS family permease